MASDAIEVMEKRNSIGGKRDGTAMEGVGKMDCTAMEGMARCLKSGLIN